MDPKNPQPETLDPNVEIPKDAPLAMGHDEDDAADHRKAVAEHKAAVEAETEDVGPRDPGDHAEKSSKKKSAD
jgi:hypothetical protein